MSSYVEATVTSGSYIEWPNIKDHIVFSCKTVTYKFIAREITISIKPHLDKRMDSFMYDENNLQFDTSVPQQQQLLFEQLSVKVKSIPCPLEFT